MAKFKSIQQAQDRNKFRPIEQNPNFVENEKKLLDEWYSSGLVDKYLHKNDNSDKYFSFLDGPITANNPMGVHHAWGRTYKDIFQRFKNMQGFKQRFQNGFDCQGLWVEVEVEKELGLKSKKDIENLVPGDKKASLAKFVQLCKDRVKKYSQMQTEQSKRLGYFMDWENSYYTMSEENNYMIWTFLKKCHEKGLIYKGHDSVPWCPRCGTAISQHEILTEDYKEIIHESVYIEYPIVGRENEYLLVWTTTPWTLPANVAIAVDSKRDYVAATGEVAGNTYYLLKEAAERLKLKVIKEIKGHELVDLEYQSPFDHLPRVREAMGNKVHKVVATDELIMPILVEEGTGLVHTAPGAGSEDFQLGKKLSLAVIEVIDEEANYLNDLNHFSGENAKDHPEIIIDFLKEHEDGKYLFGLEKYTHRYPACWRCHTELVWRVVDEWYIAMDSLREPMKEVTKKIKWLPEFGLKRELDWLDNMHDWLISKKRYWGLALPIWVCEKCDRFEVIGDKEELKNRAVEGWKEFEGNTPHRPYIDEVKIKCECGGTMNRIPDVGNPWLDAGIVPYSTISKNNRGTPLYKIDKDEWRKWFPAEFITESFPGQFRNWFYSMLAMSTVLENEEPFKTVLGFATLLAEDGKAMHKSWGNSIEFNEGADKIGVDIIRWMFAKQDPASNMLFGYKTANETRKSFFLILWNVYNFLISNAVADEWEKEPITKVTIRNPLDHWIYSRLYDSINLVTDSLEKFDTRTSALTIESFVSDLSLWYVRRSRDRVGPNAADLEDKHNCYATLSSVLAHLCFLLAPFMPFIADEMYRNLTPGYWVHTQDWPQAGKIGGLEALKIMKKDYGVLIKAMEEIREVASLIHAQRKEKQIPVRQPLEKVTIYSTSEEPPQDVLEILLDEINVKNVVWEKGKQLDVKLDTIITPELEEEGKTRELARQIQEERKKLETPLSAKISVTTPWMPKSQENINWLKKRTLATEMKKGDELKVVVNNSS